MTKASTTRKRGRPSMGKTDRLSTKITPETTAALEREAKRLKRSKSQVAERIIQEYFKAPDLSRAAHAWGEPHVKVTAVLVAKLITAIEAQTDRKWRDDQYTFEAILHGIVTLLAQMNPDGPTEVPAPVARRSKVMGEALGEARAKEVSQHGNDPKEIGFACALGLWHQLENSEPPDHTHPDNERYADGYYQFPIIREILDIDGDEK
ncbi:MAG: hypothetical protein HOE62_14740 [Alphaproteobacteria bacterium]|nr:hypothetical protein [Alphaproteobacteria bacterium]MBT6108633.1 hypothetical protein [Rhodospirillales bacterium]